MTQSRVFFLANCIDVAVSTFTLFLRGGPTRCPVLYVGSIYADGLMHFFFVLIIADITLSSCFNCLDLDGNSINSVRCPLATCSFFQPIDIDQSKISEDAWTNEFVRTKNVANLIQLRIGHTVTKVAENVHHLYVPSQRLYSKGQGYVLWDFYLAVCDCIDDVLTERSRILLDS